MTRARSPLIAPGTIVHQFSETEANQFAVDWLAVFGQARRGVNTKANLWHVFSAGRYPSASGNAALDLYKQQTGTEFVVRNVTPNRPIERTLSSVLRTLPVAAHVQRQARTPA